MINQSEIAHKIAEKLLEINAIKLSPNNLFTWASGIQSPIYCDNRVSLSYIDARNLIKESFVQIIREQYPETELIAGVATGGIAHGMLVADALGLPFVYVREKPKAHGRQNQVEGFFKKNQKVIVIEDLISTGGSSIKAIEGLRNEGLEVLSLLAIFQYGFHIAKKNFEEINCTYSTLSNFEYLLKVIDAQQQYSEASMTMMKNWYQSF